MCIIIYIYIWEWEVLKTKNLAQKAINDWRCHSLAHSWVCLLNLGISQNSSKSWDLRWSSYKRCHWPKSNNFETIVPKTPRSAMGCSQHPQLQGGSRVAMGQNSGALVFTQTSLVNWRPSPSEYRKHVFLLINPDSNPDGATLTVTLWLCQNSYWTWPFIVDLPIKNGDFP